MKCRSKYNYKQKYCYDFLEGSIVKIHKDDFKILVTKSMFERLFETINEEAE